MRADLPAASAVDCATQRPRRGLVAAILGGVIWAALTAALNATPAAAQSTVEFPVSFQVKNTDTSAVPCNSGLPDGAKPAALSFLGGRRGRLRR